MQARKGRQIAVMAFSVLALGASVLGSLAAPTAADASTGPYGPDTCQNGFAWRDAGTGDHVCVTPTSRGQAAYENGQANYRRNPSGGDYGAATCRDGYVWREAYSGDTVCVTHDRRAQVADENAQAPYRYANSN